MRIIAFTDQDDTWSGRPKSQSPSALIHLSGRGHHFDLKLFFSGVVNQRLNSPGHLTQNPICTALGADRRRNVPNHDNAETELSPTASFLGVLVPWW
jgi:hypothetical protein